VAAAVERVREEPSLRVTRLLTIEQAQRERTTGLVLALSLEEDGPEKIDAIARTLRQTPGHCPVFLLVRDRAGRRSLLKAGNDFRVNPGALNKADLELILGTGRVEFSRQGNGRGS
jgi:hypothetical protein